MKKSSTTVVLAKPNQKTMKLHKTHLALLLALGATAGLLQAQDEPSDRQGPPPPPHGGGHRPPPPPPIIVVLDVDKNSEISAEELAKATESLKTLDKDGDGKLTIQEICPPPPGPRGKGQKPKKQPEPAEGT